MLVCDKCSSAIPGEAKFCPQCGDPVTESDKAQPVTERPTVANVEISFGYSSSPNYEKAVSICQNLPSYESSGEGKDIVHHVVIPITEVELLINLYELVGNWKSSQMLINGRPSSKKDLTYYGVGCYRNRQKAYSPEQYCFGERVYEANIWGCKRLNMPLMEWGGGWLEYGEFDDSGVWHFDKDRIRHDLEVRLRENELCPVLDRRHVLETLDRLPNAINPKTDSNWAYRTSYEDVNGRLQEVAVGIRPVLSKANKLVMGDFKPSWEQEDEEVTQVVYETEPNRDRGRKPSHDNKRKQVSGKTIVNTIAALIILFMLILIFG